MSVEAGFVEDLDVKGIIGFDGSTIKGLIVHPDGKNIIYPIGNKVIVQDFVTKKQQFLSGHTNGISAVALSDTGKYIASGQINHIGFRAQLIIWSFSELKMIDTHELHKVRIEAVSFSRNERYCISLGGRDCEQVFVWDIEGKGIMCSAHVTRGSQGEAYALATLTRRSSCFITGGDNHLAVWRIDRDSKRLSCYDVSVPKMRRTFLCIEVDQRDEVCYCGTSTGDVVKVRLNFHHDPENEAPLRSPMVIGCFARLSHKKLPRGNVDLYEYGVRVIKRLRTGQLLIGAGDGTLELVEEATPKAPKNLEKVKIPSMPALRVLQSTKVNSTVTSISIIQKTQLLVATKACEIFQIDMQTFDPKLVVTCHTSPIYCVSFPNNFSQVFATASKDDVRVWSLLNMQELLRIVVTNFSCSEVTFSSDGKSILTAWNDGVIRAFTPITGRLMYSIFNAHNKGVSAMAITTHGRLLVSGGCEGQVRLWDILPYNQSLICTLKEHKGPVSAIKINHTDDEAVSASTDGTCILWNLISKVRRQIIFSNTLFMTVKYFPTGVQILTGGSDRKVCYWEILDGSLVREIEASTSGAINTLDISPSGEFFVTGGNDQLVKLWRYQEGITIKLGVGHSAVITAARFSPNCRYIVTTSASGDIFVWELPQKTEETVEDNKATPDNEENEENIKDVTSARSSLSSIPSKSDNTDSCCYSSSSSSCSKFSDKSCQDSTCSSCKRQKAISVKSEKAKSVRSDEISCKDSKCSCGSAKKNDKPGEKSRCRKGDS